MANIYWNPSSGNDSNDGSTAVLAKLNLSSCITAAGIGGTILVTSGTHLKVNNSGTTWDFWRTTELNNHTITSQDPLNPSTLDMNGKEWELNGDVPNGGISSTIRSAMFSNINLIMSQYQYIFFVNNSFNNRLNLTFYNSTITASSPIMFWDAGYNNVYFSKCKLFLSLITGLTNGSKMYFTNNTIISSTLFTVSTVQSFKNNIIYCNYDQTIPPNESYNCYYNYLGTITGTISATSIKNVNPLFVDPTNGDYRLRPTSLLKNKGTIN